MRFGFCCVLLLAGVAHAGAPPLKPNEEIVKTADGCGVVMRTYEECAVCNEQTRKHFAGLAWGGACIDGLAMGEGMWGARSALAGGIYREPTRGWAWYGKGFGWTENRWTNGAVSRAFVWEDKIVHFNGMDPAEAPRWAEGPALNSSLSDGETTVWTVSTDPPRIGVTRGSQRDFFDCPATGCEALWAQHAGPVIERIKAFIAENEPKAKARQQKAETLVAAWQKKVGSDLVARGATIAESLNAQATQESELDARCLDRETAAYRVNDKSKAAYPEQAERLGNALKQAFSGECASHPNAAKALKFADEELARGREHRQWQQQRDEERAQRRAERNSQILGGIVEGVTTFQTTKNTLEQQQAAQAQAEAEARAQAQADAQARVQKQSRQASTGNQSQSDAGSAQGEERVDHCVSYQYSKERMRNEVVNSCNFSVRLYFAGSNNSVLLGWPKGNIWVKETGRYIWATKAR